MACRDSPKEATNSTSFRLKFGHGVILYVEIYLQSTRTQRQVEIPYDHYWNMMLDEMVNLDEEILVALIIQAYNKVKYKAFTIGDYVWKVILSMDKKDRNLGKWSPN